MDDAFASVAFWVSLAVAIVAIIVIMVLLAVYVGDPTVLVP